MMNSLDINKPVDQTRVVVAMSGGVDSSVVAVLLKEAGYDVIGLTLQLYDHGDATRRAGACCAGQDIHDARRVAEESGFPHYVLDYESRFQDSVIDSFADSYLRGETPIPCVSCNQTVKFRDLLATAKDLGADALATGHYIQSRAGAHGREMMRAIDLDRDQSYFLFATTPEQLDYLRFPLGGMTKPEVRAVAERHGLHIAQKSDSQDICFVPTGRYTDIIEKLRPDAGKAGDIVHVDGRILGRHDGIFRFTIGQRRGIGIATGDPLYVVQLSPDKNEVVVGPREALEIRALHLGDVNWIGDQVAIGQPVDCAVKLRSTQTPMPAIVALNAGGAQVELATGELGIAPGQACVFYENDQPGARILGGGWIRSTVAMITGAPSLNRKPEDFIAAP